MMILWTSEIIPCWDAEEQEGSFVDAWGYDAAEGFA